MGDTSETRIEQLRTEGFVTISKAAREHGVHPATASRWANRGCTLADGRTVKLETVRTPGKLLTSRQAVNRFLQAIDLPADQIHVAARSPARRRKAAEDAGKQLETMGV